MNVVVALEMFMPCFICTRRELLQINLPCSCSSHPIPFHSIFQAARPQTDPEIPVLVICSACFSHIAESHLEVERISIRLLLLVLALLDPLLHAFQLLHDRRIPGCKLARLLQILQCVLLVFASDSRLCPPEVRLRFILVVNSLDLQRFASALDSLGVLPDFVLQQRRVEVQTDLESVELRAEVGWVGVEGSGILVQIAERFLVLCDAELEVATFEGCVAEVFERGCDAEDVGALPFRVGGFLVLRVVFVRVAGGV